MPDATDVPLPFPEVVDNTMLSAFAKCERHFWWAYMRHQGPEGENIHLHAGACYARGLEVARRAHYGEGKSPEESILDGAQALLEMWGKVQAPENSAKSVDRVLSAYSYYFSQWPMEADYIKPLQAASGPAVEFNFVLPLPGTKHPTTGMPLLYAGRFDMLGLREGALFVCDDKTTTQLGASWSQQWKLRGQFTGYCWGARQYGYPVVGAVVRGVSILKTGHDKQEAIVHRPEWMIEEWLETVYARLDRMEASWRRGFWEQNLDHGCAQFGTCPYLLLCDTNNPEAYLPHYYKFRKWDPTERHI